MAILIVALGGLALLPQRAEAGSEILREAYAPATWDTSFANVWVNQRVAQSFLARTSFLLTRVEVYVFDQPESNPPDILQVFIASDGGNEPGAILASTAQQGQRSWTWVPFSYYPWVSLSAGERYWIVAQGGQPRPKGYEWAMNVPGGYPSGEAQWYDQNSDAWVNNTGADLFFRVYGISGPSVVLEMEPAIQPADPGAVVPLVLTFNNSGNDVARTVRVEMNLSPGLNYVGDDAAVEGGSQVAPLVWAFNDVAVGPHRMTVWAEVEPNPDYFDGQSLSASAFLNYTDASGTPQATSWDVTTVTVLVPVIRIETAPTPAHVSPGETFNFTVSFFNVGSGRAEFLWLNATAGPRLTILGDDAASAGGTVTAQNAWLFRNVSAQTYVFNITAQADPAAWPGDRLEVSFRVTYTDGAGHLFDVRTARGSATIHGPSLRVEAARDKAQAHPKETVLVTLYANNTGNDVAPRAWLNATLPPWTVFLGSQPVPGVRSGDRVTYEMIDVAPGGQAFTLSLRMADDAPPGFQVTTQASLNVTNSTGALLRPSEVSAITTVVSPRFLMQIDGPSQAVRPGDSIDLLLRWNNSGNEAARTIWANFTLPSNTLLVNSTDIWAFTNGTTFGWVFSEAEPSERWIGVRLEVSARATDGEALLARLDLQFERSDGVVLTAGTALLTIDSAAVGPIGFGMEAVVLWISILAAVFLLFLLLGYMDLLPRRRTVIDDIFLLHNSGILICHYSTTLRPDVDSDIASGMLMAVRNFVADALRSKNGALQELKYGDHRIHMVHGRHAVLVVFTRGGNSRGIEMRMAEVLRNIETAYERILDAWSGRTEDFKGVEEYLVRLVNA